MEALLPWESVASSQLSTAQARALSAGLSSFTAQSNARPSACSLDHSATGVRRSRRCRWSGRRRGGTPEKATTPGLGGGVAVVLRDVGRQSLDDPRGAAPARGLRAVGRQIEVRLVPLGRGSAAAGGRHGGEGGLAGGGGNGAGVIFSSARPPASGGNPAQPAARPRWLPPCQDHTDRRHPGEPVWTDGRAHKRRFVRATSVIPPVRPDLGRHLDGGARRRRAVRGGRPSKRRAR